MNKSFFEDGMLSYIELLPPDLIKEHIELTEEMDHLCKSLWKETGWHYYVDMIWIVNKLQEQNLYEGSIVLDAGGGDGLLQFLLASRGYNVISVDFSPRNPRLMHKLLFSIDVQNDVSMPLNVSYLTHLKKVKRSKYQIKRLLKIIQKNQYSIIGFLNLYISRLLARFQPGKITMIQTDITDLSKIPDSSVDAVVSCSVIEHMNPKHIPKAVNEFRRVIKPEKPIILTTSGSKNIDWFHEPSLGWCFSKKTIASFLGLSIFSNDCFNDYDLILRKYYEAYELKKRLASSYFVGGNNGMPWGIWDPKYLPVGVFKIMS